MAGQLRTYESGSLEKAIRIHADFGPEKAALGLSHLLRSGFAERAQQIALASASSQWPNAQEREIVRTIDPGKAPQFYWALTSLTTTPLDIVSGLAICEHLDAAGPWMASPMFPTITWQRQVAFKMHEYLDREGWGRDARSRPAQKGPMDLHLLKGPLLNLVEHGMCARHLARELVTVNWSAHSISALNLARAMEISGDTRLVEPLRMALNEINGGHLPEHQQMHARLALMDIGRKQTSPLGDSPTLMLAP